MASISETLNQPASKAHLRPFDAHRDLQAVADLIELGFSDTLDEDGRRYLGQMRAASARNKSLGFLSFPGPVIGMSGFVWEDDGRVVGNLSLIPYLAGLRRGYLIANVVVHPAYRRQGIGRALTERGIAEARKSGAPATWLHVREDNDTAIRLYESLGFCERLRRTTWQGVGEAPRQALPPEISLGARRRQDWTRQRQWLNANYPIELTWSLPYRIRYLQPGLWAALNRFFGDAQVQQWAVYQSGELCGVVAHQLNLGRVNHLWLAAPAQANDLALQALLRHVRRQVIERRPPILDYPAHQSQEAIQQAGFREQQTLIWMEICF